MTCFYYCIMHHPHYNQKEAPINECLNALAKTIFCLPFYLLYRLSFRQFIDQFVELPDLFHRRVLNCLHLHAADLAGDKLGMGIP